MFHTSAPNGLRKQRARSAFRVLRDFGKALYIDDEQAERDAQAVARSWNENRDDIRVCTLREKYRINHRTFLRQLDAPPKKQDARGLLKKLAEELNGPNGWNEVRRKCGAPVRAPYVEPALSADEMIRAAHEMAKYADFGVALTAAKIAFQKAAKTDLSEAVRILPDLLYIGYRFNSNEALESILRKIVLPVVCSPRKVPLICSSARLRSIAQVGCALNEGGVAASPPTPALERGPDSLHRPRARIHGGTRHQGNEASGERHEAA